ncbi:hypothetical protein SAMN05444481_106189 [Flavobacterium frigidimaris]|nr:hypothetical protein SAMN05444481_106189 [Flavobacterium frigidimaris]
MPLSYQQDVGVSTGTNTHPVLFVIVSRGYTIAGFYYSNKFILSKLLI